ncbi:hypothetical protein PTKIN_Ptkin16aG0055700 [Pterospermum kingtungense]
MYKRLAVLVGCNYPSTQFRLEGCINDVVDMRNLLLEKFGFNASDVKVLIDESVPPHSNFTTVIPTGANIKAALNKMVDQAEPRDVLVFYFSGHGTVISSLEPGKAYSEHEAIVPCDLNLITDMDLRQLIRRLPKETSFTIISDSCHSGGLIDKDKEIIGPSTVDRGISSFYYKPKKINFGTILGVLQTVSNVAQAVPDVVNTVSTVVQGASQVINSASSIFTGIFSRDVSLRFLPQPDLHTDLKRSLDEKEGILLSGCQENEASADVVGFDGKAYGAFTNALLRALLEENLSGIISNRQLVVAVRKALKTDGFHQHACLYSSEENADAIFLANQFSTPHLNPRPHPPFAMAY